MYRTGDVETVTGYIDLEWLQHALVRQDRVPEIPKWFTIFVEVPLLVEASQTSACDLAGT